MEEEGGAPIVFFPTNLNCHVRQRASQEAEHLSCKAQVELHLRSDDAIGVSPCLPNTKPGDLLPDLALLSSKKTTLMKNSLEKVVRLDESSVLATLEERAEKRKSFPFRLV